MPNIDSPPLIGARVTFQSVAGVELTGFVVDLSRDQVRVMDRLASLEGNDWSWSEWVPLREVSRAQS